jgi:DNA-binding SARP family transcriptional activator/pimeloyl-ACP methyl ester carboxylesterase
MSQTASSPFAEVRLLGPVELGRRDGSAATVGSGLERTLLAVLAVNAGLVVSTDVLIEALWESSPPATARHALQVHVSSLRHRLGVWPSPLEARPSGYLLKLDPGQLDTERFESLAATGRAELASNQAVKAADVLEAALAVWRGPALADVSGGPVTETEVARLEEARRATEEDRLDAELAAGRSDRSAVLAEELAGAEPLRERRWGQLMLALYRCGRQAEALHRFMLVRDLLRDELGVDPGPTLRELHRRMLTQDPDLDLAHPSASPGRPADSDMPVTRFTRRGGFALAYQVLGEGPIDLVFIPGFTGHLEIRWEDPTLSRLFRRLATGCRLVLLDKRGTGMSDREGGYPPLPEHVDDLLAVMDAVGSRRAALFGVVDGGAIALLTAVAHPDRVAGVATYATAPVLSASDYPPGVTRDQLATLQTLLSRLLDVDEVLPLWAPSRVGDAVFSRWFTRYMRMGAGVGGAADCWRSTCGRRCRRWPCRRSCCTDAVTVPSAPATPSTWPNTSRTPGSSCCPARTRSCGPATSTRSPRRSKPGCQASSAASADHLPTDRDLTDRALRGLGRSIHRLAERSSSPTRGMAGSARLARRAQKGPCRATP